MIHPIQRHPPNGRIGAIGNDARPNRYEHCKQYGRRHHNAHYNPQAAPFPFPRPPQHPPPAYRALEHDHLFAGNSHVFPGISLFPTRRGEGGGRSAGRAFKVARVLFLMLTSCGPNPIPTFLGNANLTAFCRIIFVFRGRDTSRLYTLPIRRGEGGGRGAGRAFKVARVLFLMLPSCRHNPIPLGGRP